MSQRQPAEREAPIPKHWTSSEMARLWRTTGYVSLLSILASSSSSAIAHTPFLPPASPSDSATRAPSLPPSLKRRHHLYPSPPIYVNPPSALLIQPLVSTPILSPVFSLVATPCLSWVLTGSEDGFIRAWDTYASANAGLKPTIKIEDILREGPRIGGISRGWWGNDAGPERRKEAVHSLAIQREALWGLSGTEVRRSAGGEQSGRADFVSANALRPAASTCSRSDMRWARSSTRSLAGTPVSSRRWP